MGGVGSLVKVITMSLFQYQGFTLPMWSYRNSTEQSVSISRMLSTNSNAVIIDFHLATTGQTGSTVDYRGDNTITQLDTAIKTAKSQGLDIWFKPIVIMGNGPDQNSWQTLKPTDPAKWFQTYTAKLVEIGKVLQANGVSHFLLTNELFSMTNNPAYIGYWSDLIKEVRSVFVGQIGFNAGALLGPWSDGNEYLGIPKEVLAKVDFMGLSSYPRVQSSGTFTVDSVTKGWSNSAYGENLLQQLSQYLAKEKLPVYFTELGSPAYVSGNYGYGKNFNVDLESQANFYTSTLALLEKHFPNKIGGVFIYNWLMNMSQGQSNTNTYSPYDWNVMNKPAEAAITKLFGSSTGNGPKGYRIEALSVSQSIDGSSGTDTVIFSTNKSVSTVTISLDLVKVTNGLTVFSLTNVERLKFSDTNVALDIGPTQNAGSVYMLYKAAFNRAPDAGGMGYWLAQKDSGSNIVTNIAQGFVASKEFTDKYGTNPTNASYVDKLYQNVLGRAGESGGVTYWNQELDAGRISKAAVLVQFATLPEGAALVANLIANGIAYTEWVG